MALCLPISFYYGEQDWTAILTSSLITIGAGALLKYLTRNKKSKELKKKDGYLIVTAGWIFMSIFGALTLYY